jgi:hypothetical protein
LTDSIYISADYAIIRLSITSKFEIKLLRVRRGRREREGGWRREETLADNKLGKKYILSQSIVFVFVIFNLVNP